MFKGFKKWLSDSRGFLFSRYTEDAEETQEPERSLIELPPDVREKLLSDIKNLPVNPEDKEAIVSTLDEAYDLWRANPSNNNNSVVILSSPVAAVSRILSETLEDWTEQKELPMNLLPLTARPTDVETIENKLKHYLERQSDTDDDDSESPQLEAVVIPNLSWFFLRSIDGFKGIEYLQSLLCDGSENRFWIIGGGQVGWEYLNSVSNIEAYCAKVMTLPEIEPENFQKWLEPIIADLDITFDEPSIDQRLLEGDKDNKTNYFDRLAEVSNGVSTVAVQAFLKSIHYEEIEEEQALPDDIEGYELQKEPKKVVVAQAPKLPELPDLESADQYLLYSLLLHGDLTISALAESLGDEQSEVQARVQMLRHEGVIEQRDKVIKINPIHYPNIRRELASNNFVINKH